MLPSDHVHRLHLPPKNKIHHPLGSSLLYIFGGVTHEPFSLPKSSIRALDQTKLLHRRRRAHEKVSGNWTQVFCALYQAVVEFTVDDLEVLQRVDGEVDGVHARDQGYYREEQHRRHVFCCQHGGEVHGGEHNHQVG